MAEYHLEKLLETLQGNKQKLVIPRVQRAYAQGRPEEETVRRLFLSALFDVLRAPDKELVLNYAFGGISGDRFELMDGQQRLTTLFLLHWYMHAGARLPEHFDRFIYETRPTSTKFVHNLATTPLPLKDGKPEAPGTFLRNQPWFTHAFELDPTVDGMLTMLEAIHNEMQSEDKVKEMCGRLKNIRFYVPDPEYMENPDDQYCKINDRGLPLTPFECFKADLVGHIQGTGGRTDWSEFIRALDSTWLSFFEPEIEGGVAPDDLELEKRCQELDAETSRRYFRFFFRFCAHRFATADNRDGIAINLKKKIADVWKFFYEESKEQTRCEGKINEQVEKYRGFDYYRVLLTPSLVGWLWCVLDTLCVIRKQRRDIFKRPWDNTITDFFGKDHTLAEAILFSAFCDFIQYVGKPQEGDEAWWVNLENWLGVVHSIIENSDISKDDRGIARMREIHKLAQNLKGDVYESLANCTSEEYNNPAVVEEIRKAGLTVSSPDGFWNEWFYEIRKHPYLRGLTGFLLDFAEVKYAENPGSRARFEAYAHVAMAVFGTRQNNTNHGNAWAWERAVLSSGDYLTYRSYNRYNLLNTFGRGDYSWSQLLRNGNQQQKQYVKNVLDKILLFPEWKSSDNIQRILAAICDKHGQSGVIWRDLMVENPDLISRCGSGYIYFGPKILLLSKERTSSHHVELFTYHLLQKYSTDLPGVVYDHEHDSLTMDLGCGRRLRVEAFTNSENKDFDYFLLTIPQENGEQKQESFSLGLDRNFENTVNNVLDRIGKLTQGAPANTL